MIKYLASAGRDHVIKRIRATEEEGAGVEGELRKTLTKYICVKALRKEAL